MENLLSAVVNIGNLRGRGPLGLENEVASQGPTTFSNIVSTIVGVMTIVAAVWFLFILITGAYAWMGAGGDKGALEAARKKMFNGVIGLIIVIASIFILDVLGQILEFDLIREPGRLIQEIAP